MKHSVMKKVLSLLFACTMIFTMVPFSLFITFAEEDVNFTEIGSVEDWDRFVALGNSRRGLSVKITADINFGGATVSPLYDSLTAGVILDGGGHTLSNAVVENVNAMLIAYTNQQEVTVKDITLDGIRYSHDSGKIWSVAIGWIIGGTAKINNVTVRNSSINVQKPATNAEQSGTSALIGYINNATVTVNDCHVSDCSIKAVGGVDRIGYLIGCSHQNNTVTVTNCTVEDSDIELPSMDKNGNDSVAAFIGFSRSVTSIKNCKVINCNVTASNGVSALLGNAFGVGGRITIESSEVVNCNATGYRYVGGIVGMHNSSEKGGVKVIGCSVKGGTFETVNNQGVAAIVGKLNNNTTLTVQDCTIEDVTVKAPKDGASLIVGMVVGTSDGGSVNITITGNDAKGTIENTGTGTIIGGGAIGILSLNKKTTLIQNNKIDLTVDAQAGHYGGLVGQFLPTGNVSLQMENNVVTGTVSSTNGNVGGALGTMNPTAFTGSVIIKGLFMNAVLNTDSDSENHGIGGAIGCYGNKGSEINATVTIESGYIRGSLGMTDTALTNGYTGGLVGLFGATNAKLNVQNVVIAPEFPEQNGTLTAADKTGVGMIAGYLEGSNTVSAVNCVTIFSGSNMFREANSATVNGQTASGTWSDDSILTVDKADLGSLVDQDGNGFITGMAGRLIVNDIQLSAAETQYNIRFIVSTAVDGNTISKAGMNVVVKDSAGNVVNTFATDACQLYDKLTGNTEYGIEAYGSELIGSAKFFALTILHVPTGEAYTFEVTPYYVTTDEKTIMGFTTSFDVNAEGSLSAEVE